MFYQWPASDFTPDVNWVTAGLVNYVYASAVLCTAIMGGPNNAYNNIINPIQHFLVCGVCVSFLFWKLVYWFGRVYITCSYCGLGVSLSVSVLAVCVCTHVSVCMCMCCLPSLCGGGGVGGGRLCVCGGGPDIKKEKKMLSVMIIDDIITDNIMFTILLWK